MPWRMEVDSDRGFDLRAAVPTVAVHPQIVVKPRVPMRTVVNAIVHADISFRKATGEAQR